MAITERASLKFTRGVSPGGTYYKETGRSGVSVAAITETINRKVAMDTITTLLVVFALVMLVCCVGPMLFRRKRHGNSHGGHASESPAAPEPKSKP